MRMRPQADYLRSWVQAVNVLEVDGGSEEEDTGPEMEEWGGGGRAKWNRGGKLTQWGKVAPNYYTESQGQSVSQTGSSSWS